jgi:hypothetical protein
MQLSQWVESYRFWDVVSLWARERLEHEEVVARALAAGVVCDGLRLSSFDPKLAAPSAAAFELRGYPYVGYCAQPGAPVCCLRVGALEHLLRVVREAGTPSRERLADEFITKQDFRAWLERKQAPLPAFWFGR